MTSGFWGVAKGISFTLLLGSLSFAAGFMLYEVYCAAKAFADGVVNPVAGAAGADPGIYIGELGGQGGESGPGISGSSECEDGRFGGCQP